MAANVETEAPGVKCGHPAEGHSAGEYQDGDTYAGNANAPRKLQDGLGRPYLDEDARMHAGTANEPPCGSLAT